MAIKRPPSAIWFVLRIKMQHDSRDFAPVSTLRAKCRTPDWLARHERGRQLRRPLLHTMTHQSATVTAVMPHEIRNAVAISLNHSQ
jgi:hypothetical protein